jgi:hypothetical protein
MVERAEAELAALDRQAEDRACLVAGGAAD